MNVGIAESRMSEVEYKPKKVYWMCHRESTRKCERQARRKEDGMGQ